MSDNSGSDPRSTAEIHQHPAIYPGFIGEMTEHFGAEGPKFAFTPGAKAVFGRERDKFSSNSVLEGRFRPQIGGSSLDRTSCRERRERRHPCVEKGGTLV